MSVIGISPDEAAHGFSQQATHTDTMRVAMREIGNHIASLAHGTYRSDTTAAALAKWEGGVQPQLEALCNESDHKREGGQKCVTIQQANQHNAASAIQAI